QKGLVGAFTSFNDEVSRAPSIARSAVEAHIAELRGTVRDDEAAIQRLGFAKRAQDFDDWDKLAEDAQREYERETRDALTDLAMAGLKRGITTVGSLNPPTANHIVSELKAAGVGDPFLLEAIQRLGSVSGKPGVARTANEALDRVKAAIDVARSEAKTQ